MYTYYRAYCTLLISHLFLMLSYNLLRTCKNNENTRSSIRDISSIQFKIVLIFCIQRRIMSNNLNLRINSFIMIEFNSNHDISLVKSYTKFFLSFHSLSHFCINLFSKPRRALVYCLFPTAHLTISPV